MLGFQLAVTACLFAGFSVTAMAQDDDPHAGHTTGGELKQGRYIGYITLDERQERLAVVADFYLESPEDFTQFPRLNAQFKISLGGYNTSEYFTETFEDIRYDFDNGVLALDEPKNDLLMTAEAHVMGSTSMLMGHVFVRSSAVSGTLYLELESDEPGGGDGDDGEPDDNVSSDEPGADDAPFVPALEGQYEGLCGNHRASFQIQTGRGLAGATGARFGIDSQYLIVARLAYEDQLLCGDDSGQTFLCVYHNFSSASFNPYLGKISFAGDNRSQDCVLKQGKLSCEVRALNRTDHCELQKSDMQIKPAHFFTRQYPVPSTSAQRENLPAASPPSNAALSNALRGNFAGYLHNETNDTYQAVRLNVMPYSSTENPHNPNQMNVTTTAISYFGRTMGGDFLTQRYDAQSFYLRPGFTLNGPDSDSYISVTEWKKGFMSGIWFSHAFGRVGTVQLVKGDLPALSPNARVVQSYAGAFDGPVIGNGTSARLRWFKLLFPAQPEGPNDNLVHFNGSFVAVVGVTASQSIDNGTYDPYTGRLAWIRTQGEDSTLATGLVDAADNVKLFWPPAPGVFGVRTSDYRFETFGKLE